MTPETGKTILYKEESFAVQGAVFEVYRELGCGFVEAVYQESLVREFQSRSIPFLTQPDIEIYY
jgi:GxxExxY protein